MSEEVRQDEWDGFEITVIGAKARWFDVIDTVLYENMLPSTIRLGLGHTARKVTHIKIGNATEEDIQRLKAKAIEGEVISE